MTAPYPRYVEPPTMFAVHEWESGGSVSEAQAFLNAHGIQATAILNGTALWLLMASGSPSSLTYQPGMSIVLRTEDGANSWVVEPARTTDSGLAQYTSYYVTP